MEDNNQDLRYSLVLYYLRFLVRVLLLKGYIFSLVFLFHYLVKIQNRQHLEPIKKRIKKTDLKMLGRFFIYK